MHDRLDNDDMDGVLLRTLSGLKNVDPNSCPPADTLTALAEATVPASRFRAVEQHLDVCPMCTEALLSLTAAADICDTDVALPADWEEVSTEMEENIVSRLAARSPESSVELGSVRVWNPRAELRRTIGDALEAIARWMGSMEGLAYAGAAAVLIIGSAYSFAYFQRGPLFDLARLAPERTATTRSAVNANSELEAGLSLYQQGRYDKAVALLERYLTVEDDTFEAHYYAGLGHLRAAEAGLPGLVYKFSPGRVRRGIHNLESALALAKGNAFYQEDCLWFLAKAYLMMGEVDSARRHLEGILKLERPGRLSRKEAARHLLRVLAR